MVSGSAHPGDLRSQGPLEPLSSFVGLLDTRDDFEAQMSERVSHFI